MPAQLLPQFEFVFTIKLSLERTFWIREPANGMVRAGIYLKEGTFEGPNIKGIVLPASGADWPQVRPDGVIEFDARYMLQVNDGSLIYLQNRGFRWGPRDVMEKLARNEEVPHSSYYFRVTPKFDAPAGRHDWITRHVFIGIGEKIPRGNQIHYFKVL